MEFLHELILPNEDLSFKLFLFEGSDGNYIKAWHWHRSIEIFAVFEGNVRFYLNNRAYLMKAGEFMLINSNEVHSIASPEPNVTIVLQIPLKIFENYHTGKNFIRFSHSVHIQDEKIMKLIDDMYQTYREKKKGYELKVQGWFYMLLYLLVTKYRKADVSVDELKENKRLNRLSGITDYIRANYKKTLSLESVAAIFGYSPTYLSHLFRAYAQTSYRAYVQSIRVEHAYREMVHTDHTLSDIAAENGFANSKAFAREFKKKYGLLPSEFRRRGK